MDDVLLNKAANIERCLQRIQQEYSGPLDDFKTNFTKQDAIVLNLLRACEAAIDMGHRVIRLKSLGLPQRSRDIFNLLEQANIISPELSVHMQHMTGFRNIAVRNYTQLDVGILQSIIESELTHLLEFSQAVLVAF